MMIRFSSEAFILKTTRLLIQNWQHSKLLPIYYPGIVPFLVIFMILELHMVTLTGLDWCRP